MQELLKFGWMSGKTFILKWIQVLISIQFYGTWLCIFSFSLRHHHLRFPFPFLFIVNNLINIFQAPLIDQ